MLESIVVTIVELYLAEVHHEFIWRGNNSSSTKDLIDGLTANITYYVTIFEVSFKDDDDRHLFLTGKETRRVLMQKRMDHYFNPRNSEGFVDGPGVSIDHVSLEGNEITIVSDCPELVFKMMLVQKDFKVTKAVIAFTGKPRCEYHDHQ